jgi:hypothetical protein
MQARHQQPEEHAFAIGEAKLRTGLAGELLDGTQGKVSIAGSEEPVLIAEPTPDPPGSIIVGPEKRDLSPAGKRNKGILQLSYATVTLEMIGFNIVDHSRGRVQCKKGLVVFIGFNHKEPIPGQLGIPTPFRDPAASEARGTEPRRSQCEGCHDRRGRLAMGAGDRHGGSPADEPGQRFFPWDNRHARGTSGAELGMIPWHCGRHDNRAGARDVTGIVSLEDRRPELGNIRRTGQIPVASADRNASVAGDERQSTHAGTTNSHEVDRARIRGVEEIHH